MQGKGIGPLLETKARWEQIATLVDRKRESGMAKGGHRLTITLRDRNPQEAELWERIAPMLERKQFNGFAVNLLIEELLLSDEEREQRRHHRRVLEQVVMRGGEPRSTIASLHDLITTGLTAVEGNVVEIEPKE